MEGVAAAVWKHVAAILRVVRASRTADPRTGRPVGETVRLSLVLGLVPYGSRARQDLERFEGLEPGEWEPGDDDA